MMTVKRRMFWQAVVLIVIIIWWLMGPISAGVTGAFVVSYERALHYAPLWGTYSVTDPEKARGAAVGTIGWLVICLTTIYLPVLFQFSK